MFHLTCLRLGVISSTPLFLQKSKIGKALAEPVVGRPATRRVGTVVSFMHRRGYGFLTELDSTSTAGAANSGSASNTGSTFFFPRSSLDGGFYVSEGQTVLFDVRLLERDLRLKKHLSESNHVTFSSSSGADFEDSIKSGSAKPLSIAHRIRLYDVATKEERPVTPIMLFGYVENWDSLAGTGVIAELDLTGGLHDDAPRFTVSLEDLDLAGRSELRRGRYVRFCLESGDRTAARRVIIDRGAEKKHALKESHGNNVNGVDAREQRFYGTVREVVEDRFGFILLNDSGESIFFHMSEVEGGNIKSGDVVSFFLHEVKLGKHTGKKKCMRVQKCTTRPSSTLMKEGAAGSGGLSNLGTENNVDEDEFDLLD